MPRSGDLRLCGVMQTVVDLNLCETKYTLTFISEIEMLQHLYRREPLVARAAVQRCACYHN